MLWVIKGLTYETQVESTRAKLFASEKLSRWEGSLLVHSVIMDHLGQWAKANEVPLVDVIAKLNQDRDVLVSWVHLSPRGNRMIAESFGEEILKHTQRPSSPNDRLYSSVRAVFGSGARRVDRSASRPP